MSGLDNLTTKTGARKVSATCGYCGRLCQVTGEEANKQYPECCDCARLIALGIEERKGETGERVS